MIYIRIPKKKTESIEKLRERTRQELKKDIEHHKAREEWKQETMLPVYIRVQYRQDKVHIDLPGKRRTEARRKK